MAGDGVIEANLLAAPAIRRAGETIAKRIENLVKGKQVAVITSAEAANLQQSSSASYSKVDTTIAGTDIATDDALFVAGLVEALGARKMAAFTPGFQPALSEAADEIVALLHDVETMQANAKKRADEATAAGNLDIAAAWQVVTALYDGLVGKLMTPDAAGALPVTRLALERWLRKLLEKDALLVINPHRLGGTLVSYTLFMGSATKPAASGAVPMLTEHHEPRLVKQAIDAGFG